MVSVTASATSATTSAARARRRNALPTVPRLFSCSAACGATRVAVIAGSRPTKMPVRTRHRERDQQHPARRATTSCRRGRSGGASATSAATPQRASSRPASPPVTARNSPSVSAC